MQIGFAEEGLPLQAFPSSQLEEPLFCVCSTKLPAVQTGKRSHWKKTWFSCDLDHWSFIPLIIWWIKFHFQKWASATRDVRLKSPRRVHHWKSQSRVYSDKIRVFRPKSLAIDFYSFVWRYLLVAPLRQSVTRLSTPIQVLEWCCSKFSWCRRGEKVVWVNFLSEARGENSAKGQTLHDWTLWK